MVVNPGYTKHNVGCFNPLHAEWLNMKLHLHFVSFLDPDMAHEVSENPSSEKSSDSLS